MVEKELQLWYLLADCVDEFRDSFIISGKTQDVDGFLALTARQLRLLQTVCRLTRQKPEGISLKTLAEHLHLSSSTVSFMVEALVKKDELERIHSEKDRRMVLIRISPRSRSVISCVQGKIRELVKAFLEKTSPEDQYCFEKTMQNFKEHVSKYCASVIPAANGKEQTL